MDDDEGLVDDVPGGFLPPAGYEMLPSYLWTYAQHQSELGRAAEQLKAWLEELATAASIDVHFIESRAKGLTSFQDKASRLDGSNPRYVDPLRDIYDCVAARVIVFTTRARNNLAELIEGRATVLERVNPGQKKYNGYDSEHLLLSGIDHETLGRHEALTWFFENYSGLEIQIRSVAGHAWAEFEHDGRYKSAAYRSLPGNARAQIDQWFIEAGGMRRVMDGLFDQIETVLLPEEDSLPVLSSALPDSEGAEGHEELEGNLVSQSVDDQSLRETIRRRFPGVEIGADSRVERLVLRLKDLGVESMVELERQLSVLGDGQVADLMDYPSRVGGIRRLDDEILALFGDRYLEIEPDPGERSLLRLRLRRVRGKFAIYTIDDGTGPGPLLSAAAAVRALAKIVADREGTDAASVDDYIAPTSDELLPSAKARQVLTERGRIWVATNLSRISAEEAMGRLVERLPNSMIRVRRAGDLLFPRQSLDTDK